MAAKKSFIFFSGRTEFQTKAAAQATRRVGVHFERAPSKRFASRKQQMAQERALHEQRQQRELQIPAAVESEAVVLDDLEERQPRMPSAAGEEVVAGEPFKYLRVPYTKYG